MLAVAMLTCVQPVRFAGVALQTHKRSVPVQGFICTPPVQTAEAQIVPVQAVGARHPLFVSHVPPQPSDPPHVAVAQFGTQH